MPADRNREPRFPPRTGGPLTPSWRLAWRGGMVATPENLQTMRGRLPEGSIWQVIAIGRANLRLAAIGLALGGDARARLEDVLYLGEPGLGNLPQVERAVRLARDLDLEIATVEQTERLLALPAPRPTCARRARTDRTSVVGPPRPCGSP
uniref:3-keto-5-aminohexanoate cleavage protein n=1 Tax=Nonomuraea pusilla TaxID=46177 RepID=UPI0022A9C34E|nr:3-keto-5-aminohexanoate cleavage protein [Nonomuraea pusilla]